MKILSLDISSTACGWAVLESWPVKVVDFGVVKPKGKHVVARMESVAREVERIGAGGCFDAVVVEWTDGKVTRPVGRKPDGRPILPVGLAVLGQAQGVVVGWLRARGWPVETVHQNEWTRRKPKETRAKALERTCPEYKARTFADTGRDCADAIGLGLYWLGEARKRELIERGSSKRRA